MKGYTVSFFQAGEVSQDGGELIDANIEFLVGNVFGFFILQFRNEVDGRLVLMVFALQERLFFCN